MATDSARIYPSELPVVALRDPVVFPRTLPNGGIHVIVEGLQRGRAELTTRAAHSLRAMVRLAYLLSSLLDMQADDKHQILETDTLLDKLRSAESALNREVSLLELKGTIESAAQAEMTGAQRQYYLRQQLKAIQDALGEGETPEAQDLRARIAAATLPEHVNTVALQEVGRLERMTPPSPEYQMIRTYLDWVLDEIDKISAGYQGDPSAALFIATSNQLGTIHPALLDRMEIIQLSGYSEEDTIDIAKRYLAPRQLLEHGLTPEQVTLDDEAVRRIASDYTREAGGDVLFVEASLLPVGGIREKALAAKRFGINTLIHPSRNSADIAELPLAVKAQMTFVPAATMDDVLKVALPAPA